MLDPRVETFLTVCETMNFTKAASLLHITQPAVSQQVRALEEQYGTKMFRYKSRQLFLTEEGELFLRTARTMRQDAIRLQESLHQMGKERLLRFGATLTIGEYSMPGRCCACFKRSRNSGCGCWPPTPRNCSLCWTVARLTSP